MGTIFVCLDQHPLMGGADCSSGLFDRRIVFSSDIIVNHCRDFGPLGHTLLRTVIFSRQTCVSSHNYVSVFNS